MPKRPDWFPDWSGETVVVVAGGPSAGGLDYEALRGRARAIVVNNSWKLVRWADVLFAGDANWWRRNKGAITKFEGLKVTLDFSISREFDVRLVQLMKTCNGISTDKPGMIGMGRNSGFHAINLAVQFGPPRKIVLAGFDMNLDNGVHWHGEHPPGMNNPREHLIAKWRKTLDGEVKTFKKLGVEVINTSATSSLQNYPKMSLEEAMAR